MGLWAPIKKSINSNLQLPLNELIGSSTDTASNTGTTLWSRLRYVVSQLSTLSSNVSSIADKSIISNASVVKSVQRGIASFGTTSDYTAVRTIEISSVDMSKSVLLFSAVGMRSAAGCSGSSFSALASDYGGAYLSSSTTIAQYPETTLTSYSYPTLIWQVIEYY